MIINSAPAFPDGSIVQSDLESGVQALLARAGAASIGRAMLVSTATVSGTSAEQTLHSYTIPGGTVVAGTSFRYSLGGTTNHIATSGTLTFRVKIDGTSLFGLTIASQGSSGSNLSWWMDGWLTFRVNSSPSTSLGANALIRTGMGSTVTGGSQQTAVNMDSNSVLAITCQWATANASNIVRAETGIIEQVA